MRKAQKVQVENNLRYSVHLIVEQDDNGEDRSYLQVYNRCTGKTRTIPLEPRETIKVHFYRSHWLYRLWSGIPYGHVNIQFRDGSYLNLDLNPDECGLLNDYYLKPNLTLETVAKKEDVRAAIEAAQTPLSLWSIFKHNCFTVAARALGGSDRSVIQLYKDWSSGQSQTAKRPASILKHS